MVTTPDPPKEGVAEPDAQDSAPVTVLVPTGKHPALTITGTLTLDSTSHMDVDRTGSHQSLGVVLLPTGVLGLESWCLWLNFLDGMMTAHALTGGRHLELNILMRFAWQVSPFLYGTLKFWLFWLGLKLLERTAHKRDAHQERIRILWGVFLVLSFVFLWHLWVVVRFR